MLSNSIREGSNLQHLLSEVDKIRSWQLKNSAQIKDKENTIINLNETIQSQKKSLLQIQLSHDKVSTNLHEEVTKQLIYSQKFESTRAFSESFSQQILELKKEISLCSQYKSNVADQHHTEIKELNSLYQNLLSSFEKFREEKILEKENLDNEISILRLEYQRSKDNYEHICKALNLELESKSEQIEAYKVNLQTEKDLFIEKVNSEEQLLSEKGKLQTQLAKMDDDNKTLSLQKEDLKCKVLSLKEVETDLSKMLTMTREELDSLKDTDCKTKATLEETTQKLLLCQENLEIVQKERNSLSNILDETSECKDRLSLKLEDCVSSLKSLEVEKEDVSAQVLSLTNELEQAKELHLSLTSEITSLKENIKQQNACIEELKTDIVQKEEFLAKRSNDVAVLNQELDEANNNLSEVVHYNKTLNEEINEKNVSLEELKKGDNQKEELFKDLQLKVQQLEIEKSQLAEKNTQLESDTVSLSESEKKLCESIKALTEDLESERKKNADIVQEHSLIKENLASLEGELRDTKFVVESKDKALEMSNELLKKAQESAVDIKTLEEKIKMCEIKEAGYEKDAEDNILKVQHLEKELKAVQVNEAIALDTIKENVSLIECLKSKLHEVELKEAKYQETISKNVVDLELLNNKLIDCENAKNQNCEALNASSLEIEGLKKKLEESAKEQKTLSVLKEVSLNAKKVQTPSKGNKRKRALFDKSYDMNASFFDEICNKDPIKISTPKSRKKRLCKTPGSTKIYSTWKNSKAKKLDAKPKPKSAKEKTIDLFGEEEDYF